MTLEERDEAFTASDLPLLFFSSSDGPTLTRTEKNAFLRLHDIRLGTNMQESDELLEAWHIGEDTYSLEPYDIGKGQFGLVKGAYWNGSAVALKLLFNSEQEENISLFRKELAMMQQLHHPHIVQFLGWTKNVDGMFGLVMEYLPNGSIEEYLSKHRVSRPTRLMWADQMAQAITYLHNRKPKCLM